MKFENFRSYSERQELSPKTTASVVVVGTGNCWGCKRHFAEFPEICPENVYAVNILPSAIFFVAFGSL